MGVAGQRGRRLARAQRVERAGHLAGAGGEGGDGVPQVEAERGEDLVVARAPEMEAGPGLPRPSGEPGLEGGVDVLVREGDPPLPRRVLRGKRLQPLADGGEVRRGEQPHLVEHAGVGDRGPDVIGDEAGVEGVVLAGGVAQHALVERLPLVPQPAHAALSTSRSA